jgi:hypothetical protein
MSGKDTLDVMVLEARKGMQEMLQRYLITCYHSAVVAAIHKLQQHGYKATAIIFSHEEKYLVLSGLKEYMGLPVLFAFLPNPSEQQHVFILASEPV